MKMPVEIMHGAFPNFLIPGLFLTGLGILTTTAFFEVLHKSSVAWFFSILAMGGYSIWFLVEIMLVGTSWLQIMWGLPVVVGFLLTFPMIPSVSLKGNKLIKY